MYRAYETELYKFDSSTATSVKLLIWLSCNIGMCSKSSGSPGRERRYLLGHALPDSAFVWHGNTATTAGTQGDLEFWIPRAANRFYFMGSKHFVHGGAMLQEIVMPVITVRHKKNKEVRDETKVKQHN
jgi:hypothetical protein